MTRRTWRAELQEGTSCQESEVAPQVLVGVIARSPRQAGEEAISGGEWWRRRNAEIAAPSPYQALRMARNERFGVSGLSPYPSSSPIKGEGLRPLVWGVQRDEAPLRFFFP
jgi:hypothetical protein